MIHQFTDKVGNRYGFDFDIYAYVRKVEIIVYSFGWKLGSSTSRPCDKGKIIWYKDDDFYLTDEAMNYAERLAKLTAFL